jgi:hypothetical protein
VLRPYTPDRKQREVPLDVGDLAPGLFHQLSLVENSSGRFVKIDGDVYGLGDWLNLPLSQDEVEVIFDALVRAEILLDALKYATVGNAS